MQLFGMFIDIWTYAFIWFWSMIGLYLWAGWAYESEKFSMSTIVFVVMIGSTLLSIGFHFC